jgi:hypothetical protein
MKKAFFVTAIALVLVGCTDPQWVKSSAKSANDLAADKDSCEQSALAATSGKGGTTHCSQSGICTVDGFGPGYQEKFFDQCMQAKGWTMHKATQSWVPDGF